MFVTLLNTLRDMRRHPEVRTVALLFFTGAVVAMIYNATWGGPPQYWRNTTFMQSLMWACGHGFENPRVAQVPGLADFLDGKADTFDCGCIPADVDLLPRDVSNLSYDEIQAYHPQPEFVGFLAWQRYHLYLVWAVALLWRCFGISWSALAPLFGLLYGVSIIAGYGLFRLAMRRPLAVICAFLLMIAPLHLEQVPHLRDYSKAPFLLTALLILGVLVKHEWHFRGVLALAAAYGALLGIGCGFRTDVLIAFPPFIIVALMFLPGRVRETWAVRLGAVAVCTAALAAIGFPVLRAVFGEAGHFAHVALLGLLDYCDQRLGVAAPLYSLGGPFSDYYVGAMVQSHAFCTRGVMLPAHVMTADYHVATQPFLNAYLHTFPADFLTRAFASALRVLTEMRANPGAPWPAGITNAALQQCWMWRSALVEPLLAGGLYTAVLALLVIAGKRLRWGFAACFLLLYFAGYPAIQFSLRHAFHLEFLRLWFAGLLLQALWFGLRQAPGLLKDLPRISQEMQAAALRMAALGIAALLVIPGSLFVARRVQAPRVRAFVQAAVDAPREPLALTWQETAPFAFVELPGFAPNEPGYRPDHPIEGDYLMIEVTGGQDTVPIDLVYEAEDLEHWDFSRTLGVPAGGTAQTRTMLFFPIYYGPQARFKGLRVSDALRERVTGVYRLENGCALPLWMTLVLPPGWERKAAWQVFTR